MRSIFRASLLLPGLLLAGLLQDSLVGCAAANTATTNSANVTKPEPFPAEFYELVKEVILPFVLINKRQQKFLYSRVDEGEIRKRIQPEYLKRGISNKQIKKATLMDLLHNPQLVKQILDLYALYYIEAFYAFEIGLYEPIATVGPEVVGFIHPELVTSDVKPGDECLIDDASTPNATATGATSNTAKQPRQLGSNSEQSGGYYDTQEVQQFINDRNEPFPMLARLVDGIRPLAFLGVRSSPPLLGRNFAASFSVASGIARPSSPQNLHLKDETEKSDQVASQTSNGSNSLGDIKSKRETTTSHDSDSSSARRKNTSNNRRHRHSRRHATRQTRWHKNDDFRGNFDRSVNGKYVGYALDGSTEEETRYMRLDPHQRWDNPNRDSTRKILIDPLPNTRTYVYEPSVYEVDETPDGLHFYPRYANLPGAQAATPYNGEAVRGRTTSDTQPTSAPANRAVEDSQRVSTGYPAAYYRTCNRGEKNCFYAYEGNTQGRYGEDESSYDQDTTDTAHDEPSGEQKTKRDSTNSQTTSEDQGQYPASAATRSNASNTSDGISAASEAYVSSGNVPQPSAATGNSAGLPGTTPQLFDTQRAPLLSSVGRNVRGRLRDLISRTSPVTYQRRVVAQ